MRLLKVAIIKIDEILFNEYFMSKYNSICDSRLAYRFNRDMKLHYTVYSVSNQSLLTSLAQKYGSDKGSNLLQNPYPWAPHTYTTYYEALFGHCREKITKVFECGIGSSDQSVLSNMSSSGAPGASLRMWRDYFPNAIIVGGDIDPKTIFFEDRIKSYVLDQTNPELINSFWLSVGEEQFDIIIDDGLHTFNAGITLFENSIARLKPNGVYIIEDITPADLLLFKSYFSNTSLIVNYITLFYGENKVGDDCLITIRKQP